MPKNKIKVDNKQLIAFEKKLRKFHDDGIDDFIKQAIRAVAAQFLEKVIRLTPVGDYDGNVSFRTNPAESTKEVSFTTRDGQSVFFVANNPPRDVSFSARTAGKQGGTLRRGWNLRNFKKVDGGYEVEIYNDVHYAPFVENGHMIRNTAGGQAKGWVKGRFMLRNTEIELTFILPEILEQQLSLYLSKHFKG